MGTSPRPPAKRARQKILLVDSGKYLSDASLERPVGYTRDSQRELHINTVSPWAGLRSSILSTHFAAKASRY